MPASPCGRTRPFERSPGSPACGASGCSASTTTESLSGLHDLVQVRECNVNNNAALCISDVFEVCGDIEEPPEGITNNNDDGC